MDAAEVMATEPAQALLSVFAELTTPEEVKAFLLDLCTLKEIVDLSQRLEVARLLDSGESYLSVQQSTGASSTTVSRVSKCLNGPAGGYRAVLAREVE
jgi:TrpR-related protein YerC/YecD